MNKKQGSIDSEKRQKEMYLKYFSAKKHKPKKTISAPKVKAKNPSHDVRKALKRAKKKLQITKPPAPKQYMLYALLLENGKYYIGMTSYHDVRKRFAEHSGGEKRAALWTKLHRPVKVLETRKQGVITKSQCSIKENAMTIEYMIKYGIDHVRGGDMCCVATRNNQRNYDRHMKGKRISKPKKRNPEDIIQERIAKELSWISC